MIANFMRETRVTVVFYVYVSFALHAIFLYFNNDMFLLFHKTSLTLMEIVKKMTMKAKLKTVITTARIAKMRMTA